MGRNRGKKKETLASLARKKPTHEERLSVGKSLQSGHPIVSAILAAGFLEYEIDSMLAVRLPRNDQDALDILYDPAGPLATFNQKISPGYALRLYDEHTRDNLDIIRKIRNAFAHSKINLDFDNKLILKELGKVSLPSNSRSKLYKNLMRIKDTTDNGRARFSMLFFVLANQLIDRELKRLVSQKRRSQSKRQKLQSEEFIGLLGGGPPKN